MLPDESPLPAAALPRQLALPFAQHGAGHYDAAPFLPGEANAQARAWVADPRRWPAGRLAVWGEAGVGKTHLLHSWCRAYGAVLHEGLLLRGPDPGSPAAGGGTDAPPRAAIAVDDADTAAEEPLLHLLNAAAEAGQPVLLSGRLPPARWATGLPDLSSRLRALVAVALQPPEDALLRALLSRLLAERQLDVPAALQDWLLARLPRTGGALREAAARLDRAALASGGGVTRPLAALVLRDLGDDDFASAPSGGSYPGPRLL